MPDSRPASLIATLGTEAQVVTAALDLLERQGERIEGVMVLHTSAPGTPVGEALDRLRQAFASPPYAGSYKLRPKQ